MKSNRLLVVSIHVGIVLSGMALDASAQQGSATAYGQMSMSAGKMATPAQSGAPLPASTQALETNAAKMMKDMSASGYTGDTHADLWRT